MSNAEVAEFKSVMENIGSDSDRKPLFLISHYNSNGDYIGTTKTFTMLVVDRGIIPETYADNRVCSIGKSLYDGKWYGWSHRALFGFSVGDEVKDGDICASSGWTEEYLKTHKDPYVLSVGFKANNEADCIEMAKAFANSVA